MRGWIAVVGVVTVGWWVRALTSRYRRLREQDAFDRAPMDEMKW
jgi:hypothetical protein